MGTLGHSHLQSSFSKLGVGWEQCDQEGAAPPPFLPQAGEVPHLSVFVDFLPCTWHSALGTALGAGDAPGTKICMVLAHVEFRSGRGETTN